MQVQWLEHSGVVNWDGEPVEENEPDGVVHEIFEKKNKGNNAINSGIGW